MRWKGESVPLVVCFLCILVWAVFMLFNLELLGYVFSHEGGGIKIGLLGIIVIGLAVIGGAFLMAWAAEAGQFIFSQAFALALLAILEVFPEYMFEASLAWKRCVELAAATMTGSNRLLLGAGWPLVFFIYALSCKRRSGKFARELVLDIKQSVEIFFLVVLTLYSFIIVLKATLDIVDTVILFALYGVYIYLCYRMPAEAESEIEHIHGPAKLILRLGNRGRVLVMLALMLLGGVVIFFSAPLFLGGIIALAISAGVSVFLTAQWLAPFLSEFPESTSAFYYATREELAPMGIGNLVSAKVNQWSLLIGTIPLVYSFSVGQLAFIPLNELQRHEILLTAAQSIYGTVALMKLRFTYIDALILFGLWFIQFIYPPIRIEVTILYFILALAEFIYYRRENGRLFREFIKAVKGQKPLNIAKYNFL